MKIKTFSFLICSLICTNIWSQCEISVINKVADEICSKLDTCKNLKNLSRAEGSEIINQAIQKYQDEWQLERNKYPNSDLRGLLTHQLLIDCKKYWPIDIKLDYASYFGDKRYFSEILMYRYFAVKRFMVEASEAKDASSLLVYFNKNLNRKMLAENLTELIANIQSHAKTSIIDISATPKSNIFYTDFIDYKEGFSAVKINFQFNDSNDLRIDNWTFFPYDKLRKDDEELEKMNLEDIPMPPVPKSDF